MEQIKLFKININTTYLNEIKKKNILFKHKADGVLFTKITKNTIKNNQLLSFFTNFNEPMYETLLPLLPTKIYLDCDFTNLDFPQFLEKEKIINNLNNYLIKFLCSKSIDTNNIIYMDASRKKANNTYKISLHIVVNNIYVKNRKLLKELIKEFQTTLQHDILYYNSIDTSVYNQPQLFKCILSPSKDDNTLLKPFIINNKNFIYYDNNYIINNIYDFLVGLYHFENIFIDDNLDKLNTKNSENFKNSELIKDNQKKWILNNNYIKNIYELKNKYLINNKIDLIRINSAYCKICNRVHDNENAYCNITTNSIFFHCGRNPSKGVLIGSWYKNYNSNNNNNKKNTDNTTDKGTNTDINNNDYNNLNNIIKEMKEYISNLESKYNKLKEEFNIYTNKNDNSNISKYIKSVKKYTKDINSEMWQKYYALGESVYKGLDYVVNNIIKSWRDGSVGRLKKRGLLIYEYINYIKSNNIVNTLSMRKIFHKKNYETFPSLFP